MIGNIRKLMATALAILGFALTSSAAKAESFTGNYPVLETQVKAGVAGTIKGANQNFCLVLTDDGSFGGSLTGGQFYVIGNNIFVNFVVGSSTGEAAGLVIFAPANVNNGAIGTGSLGLTGGVPSSGLASFGV